MIVVGRLEIQRITWVFAKIARIPNILYWSIPIHRRKDKLTFFATSKYVGYIKKAIECYIVRTHNSSKNKRLAK